MISKTKFPITVNQIEKLFKKAGFRKISGIEPLGDGEYNAVYSVTADGRDYAVKIAPSPDCEVLTYEKDMMKAEIYWYEQLHKKTDIKAPAIIYSDFSRETIGTDWFIMEKIGGNALRHCKLSEQEKEESERAILDVAAAMHKTYNNEFGYPTGEKFATWYDTLEHIINDLIKDCAKKGYKCRNGERMLSALKNYKDVFTDVECTMVNFDLHTGNMMYDPENLTGKYWIVDLERGFWGDKILDFVCFDAMHPMEKKTKTLAYYNCIAEKKIVADEGIKLRYAMGQALMGLIMETEKYYRYTRHHFGWWRNVFACLYFYNSAFGVLEK